MRKDHRLLSVPALNPWPIRPGRDDDGPGLIDLIRTCWVDYEDCVLDVDREAPELRRFASHVAERGGQLLVAGKAEGLVAVVPGPGDGWWINRMYVAPAHHGAGLADALMDRAEAAARAGGAERLSLHSDSRFLRAHAFYEKRSFLRGYPVAVPDDLARTTDLPFSKPLRGLVVEQVSTAGAFSAVRRLADILAACVADGASVSFLAPISIGAACGFWRMTAGRVAAGRVKLFVAWLDGVLVGTTTLDFDTKPNQAHRADIFKVLVHPAARRLGVGNALMEQAENAAWSMGRTLLVLDTKPGSDGERLYGARGWTEVGAIPGFARTAEGEPEATTFFYKEHP